MHLFPKDILDRVTPGQTINGSIFAALLLCLTFIPTGRAHFKTIAGKLEALGFFGIISSLGLFDLLIYLNEGDAYLSIFGLIPGIPLLISILVVVIGSVSSALGLERGVTAQKL